MRRMIFDGEKLTDLLEPLELGWKQRSKVEIALMKDLVPQLKNWPRVVKHHGWRRMNKKSRVMFIGFKPIEFEGYRY